VPRFVVDRYIAPDIERAAALVRAGALARAFRAIAGLPALWTPV
jgi:histidine ammonia-lyase